MSEAVLYLKLPPRGNFNLRGVVSSAKQSASSSLPIQFAQVNVFHASTVQILFTAHV